MIYMINEKGIIEKVGDGISGVVEGVGNTFTEIGETITTSINNAIAGAGEAISTAIKEALKSLGKWVALGIVDNSYYLCLGVAMVGLILYLGGWKKGAKLTTISLIVFVLLQALGGLIR